MNTTLLTYAKNFVSQYGEDGIIERIFEILPTSTNPWCVEFGAWDGKHLSNCYHLITACKWKGVFIEANKHKFIQLQKTFQSYTNDTILIQSLVNFEGENKLDNILAKTPIPIDFDLISIDIDGNDYHIWESITTYQPKVVVIEFNPSIPTDIIFIQAKDMKVQQGTSILALFELGKLKGYELIAVTDCNAFFTRAEYYSLFEIEYNQPAILWKNEIQPPRLFQLYDGTLVLSKPFDLFWTKKKVDVLDLQVIPASKRIYKDSTNPKSIWRRVLNLLLKTINQ
jgi:hypothetical protein